MNELDLDKRLSVQDCEDTIIDRERGRHK
jgi:hypothetical protein